MFELETTDAFNDQNSSNVEDNGNHMVRHGSEGKKVPISYLEFKVTKLV